MKYIKVILDDDGCYAKGKYYKNGKIEIEKGSRFRQSVTRSFKESSNKAVMSRYNERKKMIDEKILNDFILQRDYEFPSPSYALGVIAGKTGTEGLKTFKLEDGRSLKQFLESDDFKDDEETSHTIFNINIIIEKLKNDNIIFISEKDFQDKILTIMEKDYPNHIRIKNESTNKIDLAIIEDDKLYAINLRYKTKELKIKDVVLKNHGAQDLGRYDYLLDVHNLETLVKSKIYKNICGYAILLTNDPSYWEYSNNNTVDKNFRIHEGSKKYGVLSWGEKAGQGTIRGREIPISLSGKYEIHWQLYNEDLNFKYCLIKID